MCMVVAGDDEWQSSWAIRHLFGKTKQVGNSIGTILLCGSDAFKEKVIDYVLQIGVKNVYDNKTKRIICNDAGELNTLINYNGDDNDILTNIFTNNENISLWEPPMQGIVFSNNLEKFDLAHRLHDYTLANSIPLISIRDEVCFMFCGLVDDDKTAFALPNNNVGYEHVRRFI